MGKENTKNAKMPLLLQPNNSKRSVCSFATRKYFKSSRIFRPWLASAYTHRCIGMIATKIRRKSLPVTQRNVKNIANLFSFLSPSCFLFGTSFYNLRKEKEKNTIRRIALDAYSKKKTRSEYCEYLWESSEQVHEYIEREKDCCRTWPLANAIGRKDIPFTCFSIDKE